MLGRNLSNQRYSICESIRTIKDPWKEYKSTIKDKYEFTSTNNQFVYQPIDIRAIAN